MAVNSSSHGTRRECVCDSIINRTSSRVCARALGRDRSPCPVAVLSVCPTGTREGYTVHKSTRVPSEIEMRVWQPPEFAAAAPKVLESQIKGGEEWPRWKTRRRLWAA